MVRLGQHWSLWQQVLVHVCHSMSRTLLAMGYPRSLLVMTRPVRYRPQHDQDSALFQADSQSAVSLVPGPATIYCQPRSMPGPDLVPASSQAWSRSAAGLVPCPVMIFCHSCPGPATICHWHRPWSDDNPPPALSLAHP